MFGYRFAMACALTMTAFTAHAGDFDAAKSHDTFMDAFNSRDWDAVKSVLTEDSVFHRASGEEAFVGRDAIVERFSSTIGAPRISGTLSSPNLIRARSSPARMGAWSSAAISR